MGDLRIFIWIFIGIGAIIVAMLCGGWELIDWIFLDDIIRSDTPIIPEIELVIKNNTVDTVWLYKLP